MKRLSTSRDYVVTNPGKTPLKKKQILAEDEVPAPPPKNTATSSKPRWGAEAIKKLLGLIDLNVEAAKIRASEIEKTNSKQKIKDLTKLA